MSAPDISDGTADQQIASYVDRDVPLEDRIEFVRRLLPYCVGPDERTASRGLNIACRVLGIRYQQGRYACMALRTGSRGLARRHGGPADPRVFGFVYECEPVDCSDLFKVGFSQAPTERIHDLSVRLRVSLSLRAVRLGTMLNEHAQQVQLRPARVFGEWFARPGATVAGHPILAAIRGLPTREAA